MTRICERCGKQFLLIGYYDKRKKCITCRDGYSCLNIQDGSTPSTDPLYHHMMNTILYSSDTPSENSSPSVDFGGSGNFGGGGSSGDF